MPWMRFRISQRSVFPTRTPPPLLLFYHSTSVDRCTAGDGPQGMSVDATDSGTVVGASASNLTLFIAHSIIPSAAEVSHPSRANTPPPHWLALRGFGQLHSCLSSLRASLAAAASGSGGRLMTWLRSTALLQGIELPDNGRANACPLSPTSATTCNASNVPVVAQRRSLLPQAAPGGDRGVP